MTKYHQHVPHLLAMKTFKIYSWSDEEFPRDPCRQNTSRCLRIHGADTFHGFFPSSSLPLFPGGPGTHMPQQSCLWAGGLEQRLQEMLHLTQNLGRWQTLSDVSCSSWEVSFLIHSKNLEWEHCPENVLWPDWKPTGAIWYKLPKCFSQFLF